MRIKHVWTGMFIAVLIVGCAGPRRPPPPTIVPPASSAASPTASPTPSPAGPAAITDREPLPSCGFENAGQQGPWNDAGRTCFWTAYREHRPAEFISTRPTIEGDPITSIFRVLPSGEAEIFMDLTHDKFSSPADPVWHRFTCPTLQVIRGSVPSLDFGPDGDCVETTV